jgi:hypothetical protein
MSYAQSLADSLMAVRIVSLPRELRTSADIKRFVSDMLMLGETKSVKIAEMQTESGVKYRSASVDLWPTVNYYGPYPGAIMAAGIAGISVPCTEFSEQFTFDNGKPMSHIKLQETKTHSPSTEPLQLGEGEWTSLYISIVPEDLAIVFSAFDTANYNNEEALAAFFEYGLKIGKVSRIDFMSKPVHGSDRQLRCAYVHFDHWFNNQTSSNVRKTINGKGEFSCNGFHDGFAFRRFQNGRYLNLKVNHKPIPAVTADLNIHQLAAANAAMAQRIVELEEQLMAMQPVPLSVPLSVPNVIAEDALRPNTPASPPMLSRENSCASALEEGEALSEQSFAEESEPCTPRSSGPPLLGRQNSA